MITRQDDDVVELPASATNRCCDMMLPSSFECTIISNAVSEHLPPDIYIAMGFGFRVKIRVIKAKLESLKLRLESG